MCTQAGITEASSRQMPHHCVLSGVMSIPPLISGMDLIRSVSEGVRSVTQDTPTESGRPREWGDSPGDVG